MDDLKEIRVLIAEDDYLASEKIKEVVESIGYTVVGEAVDGLEAVEMTKALRPDVVLMDIKMPGIDGLEATRQIQAQCPTPVVVLTAYQSSELVDQASAAGVGAYLVKPPNARYLARTVAIARARFHDMMALRRLNAELQAEIEERKQAEAQLRSLLEEKQVLLKEVHHRVKNNLAVISSLLNIQTNAIEDEQARAALQESQARIRAMARLHEQLYKSRDLARIEMNHYIHSLADRLRQSYGAYRVSLKIGPGNVTLGINIAVPCGLIINELISNAMKYAFPAGVEGEILVEFNLLNEKLYQLIISDNGVGLPSGVNWEETQSLGLQLVYLLTQQIDGSIETVPTVPASADRPGTTFTITFPAE